MAISKTLLNAKVI